MSNAPEVSSAIGGENPSSVNAAGKGRGAQNKREDEGWVSPSYNVSRSVKLDPQVMLKNGCVAIGRTPEAEAYRILRTRIMHRRDPTRGKTFMVTSPLPGEGKTLTAVNLALTFAKEFSQTVLLVDCDLRSQKVHEVLGYPGEKGLVNYLVDHEPLTDLIVWPQIEKLTVISGGRYIEESTELLGSPGMQRLLQEMKERYPERLILIDAPPVLAGADALALAPQVDHIIVVVRAESTTGKDVQEAVSLLPPSKVLGMVLNRSKSKDALRYPSGYSHKTGRGKAE